MGEGDLSGGFDIYFINEYAVKEKFLFVLIILVRFLLQDVVAFVCFLVAGFVCFGLLYLLFSWLFGFLIHLFIFTN